MTEATPKLRLDKWLWHARFFKTRSLASKVVSGGHVRVNGAHVKKPAFMITSGDVLTFPQARTIRVVKVLEIGERRGPAPEAQTLYHDLSPPEHQVEEIVPSAPTYEGKGRPTKKDRRKLDLKRAQPLE